MAKRESRYQHRLSVTPDMHEYEWFVGKPAAARQRFMFHCFRVGFMVTTGQWMPGNTAAPAVASPAPVAAPTAPTAVSCESAENFAMEFAGICHPEPAVKATLN